MKYIAQPYKENSFIVKNEDRRLGVLLYKGLFKTNVSFTLKCPQDLKFNRYRINSNNFWKPTFSVTCGSEKIIEISNTWDNKSTIEINFRNTSEKFLYKKKSLFRAQFTLEDINGNILLNLTSNFILRKLRFSHTIISNNDFETRYYKDILYMTLIFYTNYMVTAAMASNS